MRHRRDGDVAALRERDHAMFVHSADIKPKSYAEAAGVWARGMDRFRMPLEETWKPDLDGRDTRDEAIAGLVMGTKLPVQRNHQEALRLAERRHLVAGLSPELRAVPPRRNQWTLRRTTAASSCTSPTSPTSPTSLTSPSRPSCPSCLSCPSRPSRLA